MARTLFNATKRQLLLAAALAANSAIPVGMGHLHFEEGRNYTADEMKSFLTKDGIDCDYVHGRCTKFRVHKPFPGDERSPQGKKYKYITGYETQPTYETWFTEYPTYIKLLEAAGITDYEVVGPR